MGMGTPLTHQRNADFLDLGIGVFSGTAQMGRGGDGVAFGRFLWGRWFFLPFTGRVGGFWFGMSFLLDRVDGAYVFSAQEPSRYGYP